MLVLSIEECLGAKISVLTFQFAGICIKQIPVIKNQI